MISINLSKETKVYQTGFVNILVSGNSETLWVSPKKGVRPSLQFILSHAGDDISASNQVFELKLFAFRQVGVP